jgi:hypothetical protein
MITFVRQYKANDTAAARIDADALDLKAEIRSVTTFENEDTRKPTPAGYSTYCEQALLVVFERL